MARGALVCAKALASVNCDYAQRGGNRRFHLAEAQEKDAMDIERHGTGIIVYFSFSVCYALLVILG